MSLPSKGVLKDTATDNHLRMFAATLILQVAPFQLLASHHNERRMATHLAPHPKVMHLYTNVFLPGACAACTDFHARACELDLRAHLATTLFTIAPVAFGGVHLPRNLFGIGSTAGFAFPAAGDFWARWLKSCTLLS